MHLQPRISLPDLNHVSENCSVANILACITSISYELGLQATLSQIIEHLGLDSFLEVSVKAQPDAKFKQGDKDISLLWDRYATASEAVPPEKNWCMTLGSLDSLQVSYQPRPSNAQMRSPCFPFESSGVREALAEHLSRSTLHGAADEIVAAMPAGSPASCMAALSAAASTPGGPESLRLTFSDQNFGKKNLEELLEAEIKLLEAEARRSNVGGHVQQPEVAGGMFSKVWREVSKPPTASQSKSREPTSCGEDELPSIGDMLASVDEASAQGSMESVRVDGDVLEGAVKMDAAVLAGAGMDNKQCRMM